MKGVILAGNKVVLLRNERDEWELPGGRLEAGEGPEACVAREILEELNLHVEVGPLLDAWTYEPIPGRIVVVLAYGCVARHLDAMKPSEEHAAVETFDPDELENIPLPPGYARPIQTWSESMRSTADKKPPGRDADRLKCRGSLREPL